MACPISLAPARVLAKSPCQGHLRFRRLGALGLFRQIHFPGSTGGYGLIVDLF
jgi:hypothetical protein